MKFLLHQNPTFSTRAERSAPMVAPGIDCMIHAGAKIGLLHHVGGGNLGDSATLEAVAGNLRRRWPDAAIVALSMNPDETEQQHGIKSYALRRNRWSIGYKSTEAGQTFETTLKALVRNYRPAFRAIKAIRAIVRLPIDLFGELRFLITSRRIVKSLDLLIICGGGQLTEKDGPWGFPYTIFKWIALAKSVGVTSLFLNVGAGPLTRPLSKFFTRRALFAADYVSLRDGKSQALIQAIGFRGRSRVYPDAAYCLETTPVKSPAREGSSRPVVGFAPIPYPDLDPSGYRSDENQISYDAFIGKLASFAAWLVSQSYALAHFGTDIGVDPLATEDLLKIMLCHHGIPPPLSGISYSVASLRGLLTTISGMDYVVTCRFHGVVFAHLLNKPVLAIAHHPKVGELMADLDLSSYCVDIQDFDPTLLADKFSSMVTNAEEIRIRMAANLVRIRRQLGGQFDELFGRSHEERFGF